MGSFLVLAALVLEGQNGTGVVRIDADAGASGSTL
jgi:hypothetical protein